MTSRSRTSKRAPARIANARTSRPTRRRRVAVVTGTRADYGLLRGTIKALADRPRLDVQLIVTGMHLIKSCGYTVRDIERDGWPVAARIRMQKGDDSPTDQAEGLSRGVAGIARFLQQNQSNVVLVLGDRIEALAGALAATTTGRCLAHVHGGDVAPGDFDDPMRDAITKLAHLHLVATRDAAERVTAMGEEPFRVHVVGAPGLDDLLHSPSATPRSGPPTTAVVIIHPRGRTAELERRTMAATLRAVRMHHLDAVVIHPNTDRGCSGVVQAIDRAVADANGNGRIRVVRSLHRDAFVQHLQSCDILVGNSSSGIIEAPAMGLPVVNIGPRQNGRLRAAQTVIDAAETFESIFAALSRALARRPKKPSATPYGTGDAGLKIARILSRVRLDERLRHKTNSR